MTFGTRGTAGLTTVSRRSIERTKNLPCFILSSFDVGELSVWDFLPRCQSQSWRLRQVHTSAHPGGGEQGPRCCSGHVGIVRYRWRHVLAIVTSLSPQKTGRGGKRVQWKALNIQRHEGHQHRKSQVFSFLFLNDQSSSADGVFMPAFGV